MWQIMLECQPLLLAPGWVGFLPACISVLTPTWDERNRGFQKSLKLFIQKCLDLHWLQVLGVFNHLRTEQLHFMLSSSGFLSVPLAGLPTLGHCGVEGSQDGG